MSGALSWMSPLQAVVAVNDPAVQVVQVGGGVPAAVQGNHGPDLRGNDGQHVNDHPLGLVAGEAEGVHHLQALDDAGLLLAGGVLQLGAELGGELLQVDLLQQLLHSLGALPASKSSSYFSRISRYSFSDRIWLRDRGV